MHLLLPRQKLFLLSPDLDWPCGDIVNRAAFMQWDQDARMRKLNCTNNALQGTALILPVIPPKGKWYFEFVMTSIAGNTMLGVCQTGYNTAQYLGQVATGWAYYSTANKYNGAGPVAYGATFTTGDVIGVAVDMDNLTLTFYKNNTTQTQAFNNLSGTLVPAISFPGDTVNAGVVTLQTGANGPLPCTYAPPSGYQYYQGAYLTTKRSCQLDPNAKGSGCSVEMQGRAGTVVTATQSIRGTRGITTGKWYFEAWVSSMQGGGFTAVIGVGNASWGYTTTYPGGDTNSWGYYNGSKYNGAGGVGYGAAFGINDVIGVAVDMGATSITFYKNNVSQGTAFTNLSGIIYPGIGEPGSGSPGCFMAFQRGELAYAPPATYSAWGDG